MRRMEEGKVSSRNEKENESSSTRLTVDEIEIWTRDIHRSDESLAGYVEEVRFLSVEGSDEKGWVDESERKRIN